MGSSSSSPSSQIANKCWTALTAYWVPPTITMTPYYCSLTTTIIRGILVKLVMHQISVDKIENPCYRINRFDMVLPSILSTLYWASLIFFTIYCYWQNRSLLCPKRTMAIFYKNQGQGFNL